MITITIGHTMGNQITTIAKSVYESLKAFRLSMTAPHTPLVLDPQALGEQSVSPEEVEANLCRPVWRNIGRYL